MSFPNLSKRTEKIQDWKDFLTNYGILCRNDEYHPQENKNGYINIGTAINNMCNDILYPKITDSNIWNCDTHTMQYREDYGIPRLRKSFAVLMTEFLKTHTPVAPENLCFFVGVTGCLDAIAHCLADPGEVILTPTPVYSRIYTDFLQRSSVKMWPIPIITEDCTEEQSVLTLDKVKNAYLEAKKHGQTVRAILLINPSNPLGDVYDSELLMSILEFCHEAQLHVIIDEVYALSVFDESTKFQSVLSFAHLPDPNSIHVLYGLSKDFALAGLRVGAIHTWNTTLQRCLIQISSFQAIPYPIMAIAARFVEDLEFCRKFVSINQKRMREKFNFCKQYLNEIDIPVRNSSAAFFLWTCFKNKCGITTFEEEASFFQYLMDSYHVFIVPGKELFCAQPGWFRISFTGKPDHVIVGFDRLKTAIENYVKASKPQLCIEPLSHGCSHHQDDSNAPGQDSSLENLVTLLGKQIKESDWMASHCQPTE